MFVSSHIIFIVSSSDSVIYLIQDMVVLPYKDSLLLFSRYLQQLVMESLGKEFDLDGNRVCQYALLRFSLFSKIWSMVPMCSPLEI